MERLTLPFPEHQRAPGTPSPAPPDGCEDGGQRYEVDRSRSDLSDDYPAGRTPIVSSETPQRGGSEARHDGGRGDAVVGVPDRPSSRSDSTCAAVPAKEMEPHGGRARRASSSTRTRRDVSLDVRLTKAEREAIRVRARVLAVKPSAWARAVMLDALDQRNALEAAMQHTSHETPNPELAGAVEQLRRIGANLNQALRKGQVVDAELLRAVLGAVTEVRAGLGDRTSA